MNISGNFKSLLYIFGVRRSIDVLDTETQAGTPSVTPFTQKKERKRHLGY